MWSFLFTHYKMVLSASITLIAAYFVGYIYVSILKADHRREMLAQREVLIAECMRAQDKTKEKNDELEKARRRIAADLARANSVRAKCIVDQATLSDLRAGRGEHADVHGVGSEWLYSFAGMCESYRSQLNVCKAE